MLKEGMYVRCSIDEEDPEEPRLYITGQIYDTNRESGTIEVKFYDLDNIRKYYDFIPRTKMYVNSDLLHCKLHRGSRVRVRGKKWIAWLLDFAERDDEGFNRYYVEIDDGSGKHLKKISEYFLEIGFNHGDVDPLQQMSDYEFHNPYWHQRRQVVVQSLHALNNATYGFSLLAGSRVYLLPHQVDTIVRGVSEEKCRLMLADEVGMGKTIEACVIMQGLQKRWGRLNTLIITPTSLTRQWQNEFSYKFWREIPIWYSAAPLGTDLIFPLEQLNSPEGKQVLKEDWDLCLIDEAHRLLLMDPEYRIIKEVSRNVDHILLLSATPIQERRTEFRRLLSLLHPQRYESMSDEEFDDLLDKQETPRRLVTRMYSHLNKYEEPDSRLEFIEDLQEINEELNDKRLAKLIDYIDLDSEDHGIDTVRLALAYISEHYQIERRIIRHRRSEVEELEELRELSAFDYTMVGTEYSYYERETYEALLDYLELFATSKEQSTEMLNYTRRLLGAMFSSPAALNRKLLNPPTSLNLNSKEQRKLRRLCNQWENAVLNELENVQELCNDPDLCKGRIAHIIAYLSDTLEEDKYVLFTSFKPTAHILEKILKVYFGDSAVSAFYSGMTADELQVAVDRFQSEPTCRFIVCDALGGEGRNFQMARAIIHVDLPWNPVEIEQRIGRLDRIGREEKVTSVVFYTRATLEEDLFHLWHEGLQVFETSLSGIEIALHEIKEQVDQVLLSDLQFGLEKLLPVMSEQLEKMREIVADERYFDQARQLDYRLSEQLNTFIERLDAGQGKELRQVMLAWADSSGLACYPGNHPDELLFNPGGTSINSMQNTMLVPPDMRTARLRTGQQNQVRGTFSRELAIKREDLIFFAPGESFFDSITNNANYFYRGRSVAFAIKSDLPWDWQGLAFSWLIRVNPGYLYEMGVTSENLAWALGYLPLQPFTTLEPFSQEYADRKEDEILDVLSRMPRNKDKTIIAHLGQRSMEKDFLKLNSLGLSNVKWFKNQVPASDWRRILMTMNQQSLKKVHEHLETENQVQEARNDFGRYLSGIKASLLFYGQDSGENMEILQKRRQIFNALLKGIRKPLIELDSLAFVWIKGADS